MSKKITLTHSTWAVFAPTDVMFHHTVSYSRHAAIKKIAPRNNETWEDMKKRGWYSAKVTMTWEKTTK